MTIAGEEGFLVQEEDGRMLYDLGPEAKRLKSMTQGKLRKHLYADYLQGAGEEAEDGADAAEGSADGGGRTVRHAHLGHPLIRLPPPAPPAPPPPLPPLTHTWLRAVLVQAPPRRGRWRQARVRRTTRTR